MNCSISSAAACAKSPTLTAAACASANIASSCLPLIAPARNNPVTIATEIALLAIPMVPALRACPDNTTIAGRGRASSPAPEGDFLDRATPLRPGPQQLLVGLAGRPGGRARAASSSSPRAPLQILAPLFPLGRWQTDRAHAIAPLPGDVASCPRLPISRLGAAAPSPAAAPILPQFSFGRRHSGRSPCVPSPCLSWSRGVSRCARVTSVGVPRAPGAGRMHRSAPKIRAIASAAMRAATATGRGIPQTLARPVAPSRTVTA